MSGKWTYRQWMMQSYTWRSAHWCGTGGVTHITGVPDERREQAVEQLLVRRGAARRGKPSDYRPQQERTYVRH